MPIYQKIIKVMAALHGVAKNSKHHKGYQYAGYDAVNEALRPLFVAHGIVRVARATKAVVAEQGTIVVDCLISYVDAEDGSSIDVPMVAVQPSQTTNKSVEAQQVGQAMSYACRNVELKLFALTGNPDSDDATAEGEPAAAPAVDDGIVARGDELIKMLGIAQSKELVLEINKAAKAEWADSLGKIPGYGDRFSAARNAALKRIGGEGK